MNVAQEQFSRLEMILGAKSMDKLAASHVIVFGIGGVGGYAAEGLARAGVGRLTLVDQDSIGLTNLNRQLAALHSTLDAPKAQVMAQRIMDINPHCAVTARAERYEAERREAFFPAEYDFVVDAIDIVSCKLDLIETALQSGIPIVSALGTGNKLDGSALKIADIYKTEGCSLARVVRKELRARGIKRHTVVYSPELPQKGLQTGELPPPGRRSIPASTPWVPAMAGMLLVQHVVRSLSA